MLIIVDLKVLFIIDLKVAIPSIECILLFHIKLHSRFHNYSTRFICSGFGSIMISSRLDSTCLKYIAWYLFIVYVIVDIIISIYSRSNSTCS